MQQGIGKRRALIFCGELRSFLSVLGSSAFDNPTGIGSLGCPSFGAFAGGALFSDRESPLRFAKTPSVASECLIFRGFLLAMAEGCNPAPSRACWGLQSLDH
jgi:hypothetical protein